MYEKFEELLKENESTPYRVSKATGIATATLSDWKNGKKINLRLLPITSKSRPVFLMTFRHQIALNAENCLIHMEKQLIIMISNMQSGERLLKNLASVGLVL